MLEGVSEGVLGVRGWGRAGMVVVGMGSVMVDMELQDRDSTGKEARDKDISMDRGPASGRVRASTHLGRGGMV